jgi:hypothetical protein
MEFNKGLDPWIGDVGPRMNLNPSIQTMLNNATQINPNSISA